MPYSKAKKKEWVNRNRTKIRAQQREWYKNNKEARIAKVVEWQRNNREYCNQRDRKKRKANRIVVLSHYSGGVPNCDICKENILEFLALDHKNGNGSEHRKELNGRDIIDWVISKGFPDGYRVLCNNCNLKSRDNSRPSTKTTQQERLRGKRTRTKLKRNVIENYGGHCKCCNACDLDVLSIDHINNNGAEHKKQIGNVPLYRWLKRNEYPDGYQVLCMNCNVAKWIYGYCPHVKAIKKQEAMVLIMHYHHDPTEPAVD